MSIRIKRSGGEAIGAGGYGCIFEPQLQCVSDTNNNRTVKKKGPRYISKLLFNESAKKEMAEISHVKKYTRKIKNANDYFLVQNTSMCKPAPLNSTDLKGFDDVCTGLYESGYNADNINAKLDDFSIINIPYGGINMDKCWEHMVTNPMLQLSEFVRINNSLIDLLKKGILPLNKSGFYHLDIKDENILVDNKGKTRLIDWGVSEATTKKSPIPERIRNMPLSINNPFSTLLFSDMAINQVAFYTKTNNFFHFLQTESKESRKDLMRKIAKGIFTPSDSPSHFEKLEDIIKEVNTHNISIATSAESLVVEYLAEVLDKYVDANGTLQLEKYFKKVLSHNIDVWGFIYNYISLFLLLSFTEKTEIKHSRIHKLTIPLLKILNKYYFSNTYAAKPIPIPKLVNDLRELNRIILGEKYTRKIR